MSLNYRNYYDGFSRYGQLGAFDPGYYNRYYGGYPTGYGGYGFGGSPVGYGGYGFGGLGYGGSGYGLSWIWVLLILIIIVLQFNRDRCRNQVSGNAVLGTTTNCCDTNILGANTSPTRGSIDNSILFIIVIFLLIICCWRGGWGGGWGGGFY